MKKLNSLKIITDYFFIISAISFIIETILSILFIIDSKMARPPLKILGNIFEYNRHWSIIMILINLINFGLFVYALYNFKKLLTNFKKKLIFETTTCELLQTIGKIAGYSAMLLFIMEFISKIKQTTGNSIFGFSPPLCLGALGLFLLVLSEVFKIAKNMKEENELTV